MRCSSSICGSVLGEVSQPTFISTKSRIVALEKDVKYVPNLIIKTPEQTQWRHFSVFIVNFEHILHLFPVFLLLPLNNYILAGFFFLKNGNIVKFMKFNIWWIILFSSFFLRETSGWYIPIEYVSVLIKVLTKKSVTCAKQSFLKPIRFVRESQK